MISVIQTFTYLIIICMEQKGSDNCAALQPGRTCCVIDMVIMMKQVCVLFDMDIHVYTCKQDSCDSLCL